MPYHWPSMVQPALFAASPRLALVSATLIALVAAFMTIPAACKLALRMDWVDYPTTRKDHEEPIPLLGGVAIYLAFMVSIALPWTVREPGRGVAILVAATLVSLLGLLDDGRKVDVTVKLLGQLVAVATLVAGGVYIQLPLPLTLNLLLTVLWVVGITNAFNLLDNMDGLTGGLAAVAAGSISMLAFVEGQLWVAFMAAGLGGACVGFVLHNFAPARIFLGDSGSLFVGFLLAALGIEIRFLENTSRVTWLVPILILALPIYDTSLVVYSRLRRGLNPLTSPGRDHVSHRLVELGLSRRVAVVTLWSIAAVLSLLALVVTRSGPRVAYAVGGSVLVVGVSALLYLEHGQGSRPR